MLGDAAEHLPDQDAAGFCVVGEIDALHFESHCGFKLQGSRFVSTFNASETAQIGTQKDIVVVWPEGKPASVLLQFEEGLCTVLPAIPEFIASLTMTNGELVNVVYEPSDNSWRWGDYQKRIGTIRKFRAEIAAAARFGVFRLEGPEAGNIARQMQLEKGYDPTMAIYAAYAYHALSNSERLKEMLKYMQEDLNLQLFDVGLLAGAIRGKAAPADPAVLPSFPMLAQGWAQLRAFDVVMPGGLASLQSSLVSSLWTLFRGAVAPDLQAAIKNGEIH